MSISISWITNIPTPYRNHRYEKMAELFPEYGIDFEVLYMATSEPDRYWEFVPGDFKYRFKVFKGIHPRVRGVDLHTNPELVGYLRRSDPSVVVIGGYSSPSHLLASLVTPRQTLKLLEAESNLLSARRTSLFWMAIKRAAIGAFDGYIVPGLRAREMIEHVCPDAKERPFIEYPNLVDEQVFRDEVASLRLEREELRRLLGADGNTKLWLCPARLEESKGLQLFLPLLSGLSRTRLLIAGDGSCGRDLKAMVGRRDLPVTFLGQQDGDQMARLYAAADLFVLPSLGDPFPLSPIEALAAGLPILASRRIGNAEEVVRQGINGWLFQPGDSDSNRDLIREIATLPFAKLADMGQVSADLYAQRFDSDACVHRLAESLRDLYTSYTQN